MREHSSYNSFLDNLLVACAVVMEKNLDVLIDVDLVVKYIKSPFKKSWPYPAMRDLSDKGLLRGSYTLKEPIRYNLSGKGLARSEELAEARGESIDDLIDAYQQFPQQAHSPVLSVQEETCQTTVRLTRLVRWSRKNTEVSEAIDEVLSLLLTNNALVAAHNEELSQYLARLDMGKNLLQAEQFYQELLELFLLTSLRWIYPKVAHDGLKAQIQRLMDSTVDLLST